MITTSQPESKRTATSGIKRKMVTTYSGLRDHSYGPDVATDSVGVKGMPEPAVSNASFAGMKMSCIPIAKPITKMTVRAARLASADGTSS